MLQEPQQLENEPTVNQSFQVCGFEYSDDLAFYQVKYYFPIYFKSTFIVL